MLLGSERPFRRQERQSDLKMMKKHKLLIEVEINSRPEYWQETARNRVTQMLMKLRTEVKEIGGKIHVRY